MATDSLETYDSDALGGAPTATYRVLDTYDETLSDEGQKLLRRQLRRTLPRFDALAGTTVTVARMPPSKDTLREPHALAQPWNRIVQFQPAETPSNMTLFHELAHLAIFEKEQAGHDLPRYSEEFCSLYALVRMKPGEIFAERIPYFGEVEAPIDEWPEIAEAALEYRAERGYNSHYVQHARDLFEEGLQ